MFLVAAGSVLAGTFFGCLLALLPGLHIYNILGLLALFLHPEPLVPEVHLAFTIGMVVGWSVLNTIPSVLLGAPDESALLTVLPGQKYLMDGRGYEAVMMIGAGSLVGIFLIVVTAGPLAAKCLPVVRYVLAPHIHWILWVVIAFLLLTEWPKRGNTGPAGWRRFAAAWSTLSAGLATILLSGLLGFILLYRSPVSVEHAFQNIMPAFVGLFAVPWCLLNALNRTEIPTQRLHAALEIDAGHLLRSGVAGGLGGGFAAFFPVITGGIGGLLAGHATAQRDERVFMISQGVSKVVYYTGALLLFFVPGLLMIRGGAAWILQGLYVPSKSDYLLALGSIALAGSVSFLLLSPLAKGVLALLGRVHYRYVSLLSLLIIASLVWAVTGWAGLFITAVASGIGLLPVLFGSRRLNCLGVLLLPVACNISGIGGAVAGFLGLLQ